MTALAWLGVAVLGALGAILRFRLDEVVQRRAGGDFPLGTLAVNLVGAFCLGLLSGLGVAGNTLLVAGTGLLGSFTTFSTWLLESERLAEEGLGDLAAWNLAGSLLGGFAAAAAGWALGGIL